MAPIRDTRGRQANTDQAAAAYGEAAANYREIVLTGFRLGFSVFSRTRENIQFPTNWTVSKGFDRATLASRGQVLPAKLRILLAPNILQEYPVSLAQRNSACFLPGWKLKSKSQFSLRAIRYETNHAGKQPARVCRDRLYGPADRAEVA
jgi:hypothetical protein